LDVKRETTASSVPPSARSAAIAILDGVLYRRRPLDHVLADAARNGGLEQLEPRDRAFARNLVSTVLRRLGQIDQVLEQCLEKPLPPTHHRIYDLLRVGAAQLLFLDTPAHAAVDGMVSLVPRRSGNFRGLVNAVLRRLSRDGAALIKDQDADRLNTPDWLWQSWTKAYGEDTARAIARVNLQVPPLDFTVKDPATLEGCAKDLDAQVLPTETLRRPSGGTVPSLPGYDAGDWWVQDLAAALPARILLSGAAAQNLDLTTLSAIDLCAAPGGKTAQLLAAGLQVIAVDRAPNRLHQLERNLARLGLSAKTAKADGAAWTPATPADLVLLDAPCSATGTGRRHPDIPHLKTPGDVASLAKAQARLLQAAGQMIKPGGILVYAVCSLQPEEGPEIIAGFLAENSNFARLPITGSEIGGLDQCLTHNGDLTTLPCHLAAQGGMDGFFAARLTRAE
jgi:16S rRNA (cytosine967-C5)-methyltransferase